jgi:hypothetical protein
MATIVLDSTLLKKRFHAFKVVFAFFFANIKEKALSVFSV